MKSLISSSTQKNPRNQESDGLADVRDLILPSYCAFFFLKNIFVCDLGRGKENRQEQKNCYEFLKMYTHGWWQETSSFNREKKSLGA